MNTNDSQKLDADIAPTNEQFTENHLDVDVIVEGDPSSTILSRTITKDSSLTSPLQQ